MKQTLIDLFTSKKFLAALTAIIVYAAGRFGFDVDTVALDHIWQALLVYVGAQGIADVGKGAAQVREAVFAGSLSRMPAGLETGAAMAPKASSAPAGLVGALVVLVVLGLAGASQLGCAAARPVVATGVVATLDCELAHIDAQALADARAFASAEVQRWIAGGTAPSADAIEADLAPIRSDLGRCAIAGALAAATAAVTSSTAPRVAGPPDGLGLRVAFAAARQRLGWGPVRLASGETL